MGKGMLLTVVGLALAVTGCGPSVSYSEQGHPREAEPPARTADLVSMTRPPVQDVPVPISFELNEQASRSWELSGGRFVDHVYTGSSDPFAVGRFYRRYMPQAGWTQTRKAYARGELVLDFDKEAERCQVRVSRQGLLKSTRIRIQLWTAGQVAPPSGAATSKKVVDRP